jgi:hypothetical protein
MLVRSSDKVRPKRQKNVNKCLRAPGLTFREPDFTGVISLDRPRAYFAKPSAFLVPNPRRPPGIQICGSFFVLVITDSTAPGDRVGLHRAPIRRVSSTRKRVGAAFSVAAQRRCRAHRVPRWHERRRDRHCHHHQHCSSVCQHILRLDHLNLVREYCRGHSRTAVRKIVIGQALAGLWFGRPRRLADAFALSFPLAGPQLLKRLHLPIRIRRSSELAIDVGELEVG